MTMILKGSMVAVACAILGCRPSAQSAADTTDAAASSTMPAVSSGPSDSVAASTSTTQAGKASTERWSGAAGGSSSGKSPVTKTRRNSDAAQDPGILGRDSVIRLPRRGLPTVSSTPIRK